MAKGLEFNEQLRQLVLDATTLTADSQFKINKAVQSRERVLWLLDISSSQTVNVMLWLETMKERRVTNRLFLATSLSNMVHRKVLYTTLLKMDECALARSSKVFTVGLWHYFRGVPYASQLLKKELGDRVRIEGYLVTRVLYCS